MVGLLVVWLCVLFFLLVCIVIIVVFVLMVIVMCVGLVLRKICFIVDLLGVVLLVLFIMIFDEVLFCVGFCCFGIFDYD